MIQTKVYPNGLKLVVSEMKGFESVSFNMFVKTGSINEKEGEYGISHFLEHMHFKGTKTRSSFEISKQFDALGANVNAYTSFEETDYYTKSASENAEKCVELMSDMLFNATFDKVEMERERQVVIEEIKMYDDDPQSRAEYLANKNFYAGTPFERDVAGTIASVKGLTQKKMFDYKDRFYTPQNITLSFAGKINFSTAQKYVEKYFLPFFKNSGKEVNNSFKNAPKVAYAKSFKDNEQSQVLITFPGIYYNSKNKYVAKVFDIAFGHGMSSILFQSIREKLGLVYSISSMISQNSAGGDLTIALGTSNKNVKKALGAVMEQIRQISKNGISEEQFANAKANLINSIKLSFENTSYVSLFNAKLLSLSGKTMEQTEYVQNVEAVTFADVNKYAKSCFDKNHFVVSVVGKNKSLKLDECFAF